ncbi:hypothetical protein BCV72DRAFT_81585 [Rhizopus microsporus var. microsporus]|uniref:Methyltransferase FkbM domain-containing protein n=1 Tax=Rhizopus microsporus var. microsporus TaxID=86635 RepID=A0A1X0QNA8_RHIZD|nr:hypothetical protein BCV72DRAFT_81585 [Rhizopus microsporus var. microsporus]
MRSWRTWSIVLIILFLTFNVIYWRSSYFNNFSCTDTNQCQEQDLQKPSQESNDFHTVPPLPPPPPPYLPHVEPILPVIPEAKLEEYVSTNPQPLHKPVTHYPDAHGESSQDLDTIAPTADKTTFRLTPNGLAYASQDELWQFGVLNTKPDVLVVSNGNYIDVKNHYHREHRIYTLMKWILRVHRRDPYRSVPLVMVDAGSNHGLFSLVAGSSGAHVIAFEPQTHLQSVINMAGRLNQLSHRLRILPFAVLDQFKKLGMTKFEINDGGIGSLDYNSPNAAIVTHTIRLDSLPIYDRLFSNDRSADKSLVELEELGNDYANMIQTRLDKQVQSMNETFLFRQPIHFLKIDVEGFEVPALKSAAGLFEQGLVENTILEFGPPSRWDVTVEGYQRMDLRQVRERTTRDAKALLHKVVTDWKLDIHLLPAEGWEKTVRWMIDHGVDISDGDPTKNKVVRKLMAWEFDDLPRDEDEFEKELDAKKNLVTEFIDLPEHLIDKYLDDSQSIGEMYLWFTKRDSQSSVMSKVL